MANPFRACAGICGDHDTFTLHLAAVMLVTVTRQNL